MYMVIIRDANSFDEEFYANSFDEEFHADICVAILWAVPHKMMESLAKGLARFQFPPKVLFLVDCS